MRTLLAEREVAKSAEMDPRNVRRRACELITERAADPARNGRRPRVYQLQSLAPEVQKAWLAEQQKASAVQPAENRLELALTFPRGSNFSLQDQAEAKRRYGIVEPLLVPQKFEFLWLEHGPERSKLVDFLARQNQVGRRTIYRWLKAWDESGLPGLVRSDRCDKGFSRRLNQAALEFIIAAVLPKPAAYGEYSVAELLRAYREEAAWRAAHAGKELSDYELQRYRRYVDVDTGCLSPSAQLPEASYGTFYHWVRRIPAVVKVLARQGEEAFHNTQEILSYRDLAAVKPLDYVVMDDRKLDLFCMVRSGDGWKLVRPWVTAAIDMRTRRWLHFVIVETPSSDSIASVLKHIFLKWGVPRACYWDNSKSYTCEYLEGRHTKSSSAPRIAELEPGMRGVLENCGVRIHHAIIRRARSKLVEANFVNLANYDRTLPWWCGHKPTTRPERFEALLEEHERWLKGEAPNPPFLTIEQVAGMYDEFLKSLNEREHSGEGMQKILPTGRGWMCPNEAWELLAGKVERRTVPADVLQFAFAKRRTVTVRHGELCVTFGGRPYHYRLLENSQGLVEFNGREVKFAYDPLDLGTGAVYFEDRFIGLVSSVELRRMGENDFVQDERDRRASLREAKRIIKTVHQQIYVPGVIERAARRAAVQPVRPEPERPEIPVRVPAPLLEASQAAAREKAFSFAGAAAGAKLIAEASARAYEDDDPDDGEFEFWGDNK